MKAAGQIAGFQPIPVFPAWSMAVLTSTAAYSCWSSSAQQVASITGFQLCEPNVSARFCISGMQHNKQSMMEKYFGAQTPVFPSYFQGSSKPKTPSNDDPSELPTYFEIMSIPLLVALIVYIGRVMIYSAWESRDTPDPTDKKTRNF